MTINTKQKKAIDDVFGALAYTLDNLTHTRYMADLYECERQHEKRHRDWSGNFGRPDDFGGVSIATAAKYFAARHVIEGLEADWSAKDSLHLKDTVWRAYAIALNYGDEIKKALSRVDAVVEFLDLDYSTMVQSKEATKGSLTMKDKEKLALPNWDKHTFTGDGICAISDMVEAWGDERGQKETEAILAQFTQYKNINEFKEVYGAHYSCWDDVQKEALVLRLAGDGALVRDFRSLQTREI